MRIIVKLKIVGQSLEITWGDWPHTVQHETGPDLDTIRSEYDKGSGGKLAPQKSVVKYLKVVKGV